MDDAPDLTSDHRSWYDRIAARDGGYVRTWSSTVSGRSGETAFEELLFSTLRPDMGVLDAGCGSGEFTLQAAAAAGHVVGFDYAAGMINAARRNLPGTCAANVDFVLASSRELPFEPGSFDVVYSRRGPTSILRRPDLLAPGGWMLRVHGARRDDIESQLESGGYEDVRIDEFRALERFPTLEDFARYWSRMPGHPDYLDPRQSESLERLAEEHRDDEGLVVEELRFVWQGRRPARPS